MHLGYFPLEKQDSAGQACYVHNPKKPMKTKRYRIRFDTSEDLHPAIRELSNRWNCKTNEAIARAVLDYLHRPLISASEPPWVKELKDKIDIFHEDFAGKFE